MAAPRASRSSSGTLILNPTSDTVVYSGADAPVLSGRDFTLAYGGATYTLHANRVVGAGSQGVVVQATDQAGRTFAAKIAYQPTTTRDRLDRKAVLDFLEGLVRTHPLRGAHYHQTHLMPVLARGQVRDEVPGLGETVYDVVVMPLCQASYAGRTDVSFEELRAQVLPQAAEALHLLHEARIVHRDINPKNLYLLNGSLVVGDYGIAATLDAGRDARGTMTDRRTPGYSPHTSTIQCENDWYALGYTAWTLYNGGRHPHQALIDQGDLSEVFAGKRPVPFTPRQPGHATLGQLVCGLTHPWAQGRLGYDAVQSWVRDPTAFVYRDPLTAAADAAPHKAAGPRATESAPEPARTARRAEPAYRFEGAAYRDRAKLGHALAGAWERGKRHLYTHALEEHFRRIGDSDLAVALNDIVETDPATLTDQDLGLARAVALIAGDFATFRWGGEKFALEGFAQVAGRIGAASAVRFLASGQIGWQLERAGGASGELLRQVRRLEEDARRYPAFALAYARRTFASGTAPGGTAGAGQGAANGRKDGKNPRAWNGRVTPDACFAYLAATPLGFYRRMDLWGTHGATELGVPEGENLHALLGAIASMGHYKAARTAEAWLADANGKAPNAPAQRAGKLLLLFERVCTKPARVRAFDAQWGPNAWAGWVQSNTDRYEATTDEGVALLRRLAAGAHEPVDGNPPIENGRKRRASAAQLADRLRRSLAPVPGLERMGIMAEDFSVRPRGDDGCFTSDFYGTAIPDGFMARLLAESTSDQAAFEYGLDRFCGERLRQARQAGADIVRGRVERLKDLAARQRTEPEGDGLSRSTHIVLIAVHAVLIYLVGIYGYDLAHAIGAIDLACPDVGPLNLAGATASACVEIAQAGLILALGAIIARHVATLRARSGGQRSFQRTRELAGRLNEQADLIAAGLPINDDVLDTGGVAVDAYLAEGEAALTGNAPAHGGRKTTACFWIGAAACALCLLAATITSMPYIILEELGWGFELGGWAQLVYAALGVAAFAVVARVRPRQDLLTLALLALAPVLPYLAAVAFVFLLVFAVIALVIGMLLD